MLTEDRVKKDGCINFVKAVSFNSFSYVIDYWKETTCHCPCFVPNIPAFLAFIHLPLIYSGNENVPCTAFSATKRLFWCLLEAGNVGFNVLLPDFIGDVSFRMFNQQLD